MEQTFGKLVLLHDGGGGREFGLGKASITLGRGLANDIVLADVRVSRDHARLECGPAGCCIVDLGSSNGIQLNGRGVEQADLAPGDVLGLGSSQLRYVVSASEEDLGVTRLDSEGDIELTLNQEILPMAINETDAPRLVVFAQDRTWEVPLEDVEMVTIGRTGASDLTLDQDRVSRQHAEVVPQVFDFPAKEGIHDELLFLVDQVLKVLANPGQLGIELLEDAVSVAIHGHAVHQI